MLSPSPAASPRASPCQSPLPSPVFGRRGSVSVTYMFWMFGTGDAK